MSAGVVTTMSPVTASGTASTSLWLNFVDLVCWPGQTVDVQGGGFTNSTKCMFQAINGEGALMGFAVPATIVSYTPNLLQVVVPEALSFGLFAVWVVDGSGGVSGVVYANQAVGLGFTCDQAQPGGAIEIYGRNLTAPLSGGSYVVFAATEGGATFTTMSTSVTDTHLVALVPAGLTPGASYDVYVSNGLGGGAGYTQVGLNGVFPSLTIVPAAADPFGLGVPWAGAFVPLSANVYNVKTGQLNNAGAQLFTPAAGDGITDDQGAVNGAIAYISANGIGGGVLYFPAGTYLLKTAATSSTRSLIMKSNVVLQGAGKGISVLQAGILGSTARGFLYLYQVSVAGFVDMTLQNLQNVDVFLNAASWVASTLTLTQAGAFAGYTYAVGDTITLGNASGTSGITAGTYTIASKVSNDSITLTTSAAATNVNGTVTGNLCNEIVYCPGTGTGNNGIFFAGVDFQMGCGKVATFTNVSHLLLLNSTFESTTHAGGQFNINACPYYTALGCTFSFMAGRHQIDYSVYSLIRGNAFVWNAAGHGPGSYESSAGILASFADFCVIDGNRFTVLGNPPGGNNDGELILTQLDLNALMDVGVVGTFIGLVMTDSTKTWTVSTLTVSQRLLMMTGLAAGQWFDVSGYTSDSVTVGAAPAVTPQPGDGYCMTQIPSYGQTVVNNAATNSVNVFGSMYDGAVWTLFADNTSTTNDNCTGTAGMNIRAVVQTPTGAIGTNGTQAYNWANQVPANYVQMGPIWFVRVVNNTFVNSGPNRHVTVALQWYEINSQVYSNMILCATVLGCLIDWEVMSGGQIVPETASGFICQVVQQNSAYSLAGSSAIVGTVFLNDAANNLASATLTLGANAVVQSYQGTVKFQRKVTGVSAAPPPRPKRYKVFPRP